MMVTLFCHKAMGMASRMKHEIHNDVDGKSSNSDYKHCKRFRYKLFVNDSVCRLINHENSQKPDNEKVAKCSDQLHSMVAE
jgi:hypothetical protein